MTTRSIGVYDSGIGGLFILKALREALPKENFIFFADTRGHPYGSKSKKEILSLCHQAALTLIQKNIKLLIVACNSASVYGLSYLKKMLPIPVFSITNTAATRLFSLSFKTLLILSTQATANSNYFQKFMKKNYPKKHLLIAACPLFTSLIEKRKEISSEMNLALETYLSPFKEKEIDKVLIACTHFSFIAALIAKKFTQKEIILDPTMSLVQEVKTFLERKGLENSKGGTLAFFASKEATQFAQKAKAILRNGGREIGRTPGF